MSMTGKHPSVEEVKAAFMVNKTAFTVGARVPEPAMEVKQLTVSS